MRLPKSGIGWLGLAMSITSGAALYKGDVSISLDFLQLGVLFHLMDRLPED